MIGVKESVEHILPVGNKQTNAQELNYELNPEQEYFETDELFDDEYELIKSEHLSQVLCNDPLETLRKRGYLESEINEMLKEVGEEVGKGDSWYTRITIPTFENKAPPSLMDSRDSLRKQVCVWFTKKHDLTESQEKLNMKLLNIVKYLDWYDESVPFDYDNGGVYKLEEFLKNNESNPDLKVVLNLKRYCLASQQKNYSSCIIKSKNTSDCVTVHRLQLVNMLNGLEAFFDFKLQSTS